MKNNIFLGLIKWTKNPETKYFQDTSFLLISLLTSTIVALERKDWTPI